MKIIDSLRTGKAPGYDGLTTLFVKKHKSPLSKAILYLFNMALHHGKFPQNLKIAKVIPIDKGGTKNDPSNYRPISLLPTIGKILEKLIHARLQRYYEQHQFINKNQYGFRTKCSTTIAATELVNQLQLAVDKGKMPTTIFLDVSKAFDTVKHDILLQKLSLSGVRGNMYELIKDYLTDRRQFTEVNEVQSEVKYVNTGIPQGGVLAALLFVIYTNDIGYLRLHGKIIMYADDIVLVYEDYDQGKIQEDLNTI